ncbi:MAG: penicillin acylase family protein [Acidobacteriaceae bacterium]|nr:penicillin acylase family protein [Acidobacteriaceae bacterium]
MPARLLRVINVSIAVLVVLISVAVYWYAYRPLPQISGELNAPISVPAVIRRDAHGIPHIEAAAWQDAIFLQGYATAQDRLWQMDSLRRYGAGELSEVLGRNTLAIDQHSRAMRMRATAENDVKFLRPQDRAVMVEYARGVNYYIDTHRGNYPLEFNLPGHVYSPRAWSVVDSILVGLVMYRDLTDTSQFELDKGTLLAQSGDPAKVRTLFPALQGDYVNPGSNAWAVSGAHAADGKPMLANDPHLHYSVPSTWHLVHLKAPGLDVAGAALPGVPAVITGHNDAIAWGVTNLESDEMDLYIERMDESHGTYLYEGKLQQAQLDRQMIGIRGQAPVQLNTWVTRHGPVILQADGKTYSMRWSAADGFSFPFFDIDRAQNWQDFRTAVSTFWGPPQNFVYADRAGNIGYQASGRTPIRNDFSGDVPLDGTSDKFEWSGYIPFEQLPSVFNPPGGIIATANQNPFPPGFPYSVAGEFADKYRINQIRARLSAKPKLTVSEMLSVQTDVYSAFDFFLAHAAIAAYQKYGSKDELVRDAIDILRHWNGQMDKDEAAPTITQLLRDQIGTRLVFTLASPGIRQAVQAKAKSQPQNAPEKSGRPGKSAARATLMSIVVPVPAILPRAQVLQDLLMQRPAGWVDKNDWDAWLLNRLSDALQAGRRRLGSPISKWKWGRVLQWNLQHPLGKELPVVSRFFDIDHVWMSGCGTCVKQTTGSLGPSERMVVDFGDLDKSVQNLTVGESGHVASPHYKDEWGDYYAGKSFPMQFDHVDARDTLSVKPAQP